MNFKIVKSKIGLVTGSEKTDITDVDVVMCCKL
jgi:hypothetical protein